MSSVSNRTSTRGSSHWPNSFMENDMSYLKISLIFYYLILYILLLSHRLDWLCVIIATIPTYYCHRGGNKKKRLSSLSSLTQWAGIKNQAFQQHLRKLNSNIFTRRSEIHKIMYKYSHHPPGPTVCEYRSLTFNILEVLVQLGLSNPQTGAFHTQVAAVLLHFINRTTSNNLFSKQIVHQSDRVTLACLLKGKFAHFKYKQ